MPLTKSGTVWMLDDVDSSSGPKPADNEKVMGYIRRRERAEKVLANEKSQLQHELDKLKSAPKPDSTPERRVWPLIAIGIIIGAGLVLAAGLLWAALSGIWSWLGGIELTVQSVIVLLVLFFAIRWLVRRLRSGSEGSSLSQRLRSYRHRDGKSSQTANNDADFLQKWGIRRAHRGGES